MSINADFGFNTYCFICERDVRNDFIAKRVNVPKDKKQAVSFVTSADLRKTLISKLKSVDDRQCIDILSRIMTVEDFVAVGADII